MNHLTVDKMKISIITVVYNGMATIESTLKSVAEQTYSDIEFIVIDGASKDGTINIIKKYILNISRFVSEPDNGIYDAMNKGISFATGQVIGFLNADDIYAHCDVITNVANKFEHSDIDACYGDLVYVAESNINQIVRYWQSRTYHDGLFYRGWMPPHPTFFVRRSLYEHFGSFRLNMGTSADYEIMLRFILKYAARTAYIPEILVKMRMGGASNATLCNRLKANRMDRQAWQINGLKPRPWTLYLKPLSKITQYLKKPAKPNFL